MARRFAFGAARDLEHAAAVAVGEVLGVRDSERVLVITDPDPEVFAPAQAVHDAAVARGADAVLVAQSPKQGQDIADPIVVRALETDPDVVAVLTSGPLGVDPERARRPLHDKYPHYLQYLIGERRARGFWAPGVDRRLFARTVPVDHRAMAAEAAALADVLAGAVELRLTSRAGTDLVVPVDGSRATTMTGPYVEPGQGGNLPAGELVVPTGDGVASGTLVLDGTLGLPDATARPRTPVRCAVEEGRVTRIDGDAEAKALGHAFAAAPALAADAVKGGWLTRKAAEVYAANVRRVAEVGIGLNPAARWSGRLLGDEKVRGAVHVVLGAASQETPPSAPLSLHALVQRPTLVAVLDDGAELPLVSDGGLVLPQALAR